MALKGTLKDFGIADILQLIGQQQKTGTLMLRSKDQEVRIMFHNGGIVGTESATRKKKELIGHMLVDAELITQRQLDDALDTQKRTLKRLGDVIVATGLLTQERFGQIVQLQASETLYKLFHWKTGTYAFEQGEVEDGPLSAKPLRAEAVLMEGFRMMDEWPFIQKQISRYDLTFEKVKPLPPPVAAPPKTVDDELDDVFSEEKKSEHKGDFASLGESERRLYGLVGPHRNVRKLIALSTLGEFETCKGLCKLLNLGYLAARQFEGVRGKVGGDGRGVRERVLSISAWTLGVGTVVTALTLVVMSVRVNALDWFKGADTRFADPALQRYLSLAQQTRIAAAIEMYQLDRGQLPRSLEGLVSAGLLSPTDVRYPWRETYYYRPGEGGHFVLLPPFR
ncbi:MAG: DUF4388 domain-containing protein [Myxococcaceae bacterium]